jgi:hypothetical protein
MYISPFASSLFGDDEDAGEVGGRGLLAIAAHREVFSQSPRTVSRRSRREAE